MTSEAAKTATKQSNNATPQPMTVKQHITYKFSVISIAKESGYKFAYDRTNTNADTLKEAMQN